ncbi:hypothetical protein [Lutimonas sp.]|uniref:hypothetical protein n=1 Tax=Lutimonas sp. TaxID=1872403 RepID=UPI003D9BC9E0
MNKTIKCIFALLLCIGMQSAAQEKNHSLTVNISIDENVQDSFQNKGRIFIFLTQDSIIEPRQQQWPNPYRKTHIFARNIENATKTGVISLNHLDSWTKTPAWELNSVPEGTYYIQVLWDQDTHESRVDAPGNLYALKKEVLLDADKNISFNLNQVNQPRSLKEHALSKQIDIKSDTLSSWWKKDIHLKASVLLPHNYDKNKDYPIRYNVAGYGGRYTRINRLISNDSFMKWWDSEEAPQIITVFLD